MGKNRQLAMGKQNCRLLGMSSRPENEVRLVDRGEFQSDDSLDLSWKNIRNQIRKKTIRNTSQVQKIEMSFHNPETC